MAMTKADIVEALYEKVGFSKKEAADLVELVFDTIKGTLSKSEKIKISGFGNFVVREKRSRIGRNPQTGQSIEISARRVLTFRPSQVHPEQHLGPVLRFGATRAGMDAKDRRVFIMFPTKSKRGFALL